MNGDLPRRQRRLVQAWAELHQDELKANWQLASNGETLFPIPPLRKFTNEDSMYPAVKQVEILDHYRLLLTFDNGEKRVFDVKPLLSFGKFSDLASPSLFRSVTVSFDTIAWSNGLDIDPEHLYEHSDAFTGEPIAAL